MSDLKKKAGILWGVCGIGYGHTFRQLPLIEEFARSNSIVIFGYGDSYAFYQKRFADHPNISLQQVAVPYYPGNHEGLDFAAAADRPGNHTDHATINARAMAEAWKLIRTPALVVSDYEPASAQYAYACNAPLVTLDQQSKYLIGNFPALLDGQTVIDEQMRLRMFFPKAAERLACSFFNVLPRFDARETVTICPPTLNAAITGLQRTPTEGRTSILMYLSSHQDLGQSLSEISALCGHLPDVDFHLFARNVPPSHIPNLVAHQRGDADFHNVLASCHGIVSTAGHSLLSEAMHLGIPVYAVPLPLYEQRMNARVIGDNKFGVMADRLDMASLRNFVDALPDHRRAIEQDESVLLRRPGQGFIIDRLQRYIA